MSEKPTPRPPLSESPWSKEAPPSAVLPPPPVGVPPTASPATPGWVPPAGGGVPRHRAGAALRLIGVVALAAAVGSAVTYLAKGSDQASTPASPQTITLSPPTTAQFSSAEIAGAKENLCHTFDMSVRGQEGEGGVRVAGGGINTPMVLRALNSASAVQNALVPAVPPDVASAAHKYIGTTLDQTTAAMSSSTPTSEVNRLTDARNDAINALVDVCGLPR
jgi:hypothetical protein